MRGKLIVIEGTDGSGKQTQAEQLYQHLLQNQTPVQAVSFPRYGHPMAKGVEYYLASHVGHGKKTMEINPYPASMLYVLDQWESYISEWGNAYQNGQIIVADRYVTSNILHQATKLEEPDRSEYIRWLKEMAYNRFQMPEPDLVLYLQADPKVTEKILVRRDDKDGVLHDMHERDVEYLRRCKRIAKELVVQENWQVIQCTTGMYMRPIEAIHADIMAAVTKIL